MLFSTFLCFLFGAFLRVILKQLINTGPGTFKTDQLVLVSEVRQSQFGKRRTFREVYLVFKQHLGWCIQLLPKGKQHHPLSVLNSTLKAVNVLDVMVSSQHLFLVHATVHTGLHINSSDTLLGPATCERSKTRNTSCKQSHVCFCICVCQR